MKTTRIILSIISSALVFLLTTCKSNAPADPQVEAAAGVIRRVLPAYADRFELRLISSENGKDVFEIEAEGKKVRIGGSSGVALCSGFNYYLKHVCNLFYNWRCGSNMNISGELPTSFERIRKSSPYRYRYIFNYCTFSYSMAFWDWQQWERMLDWMAMNGINMPLAPMGQESVWQKVYNGYGISNEELRDFFVGPAYNAFGRMGCLDGFGGPLPQSWIDSENQLQKKILHRERSLGMTPVLQGFTGHIPPALVRKNPGLKFTRLKWIDFTPTYLLDWEDPLFGKISEDFIREQTKEFGTDHLYAIDQFIEMEPARGDTLFLGNMSRKIWSSVAGADPEGTWVIQTWPFKETVFWNRERTSAYFGGVPDNRMIALELMGESWQLTGWYKHEGWYGKPWIWSVISSFGDNVSMFGGLTQITENFGKALSDPGRGNLSGMGLMMEGLEYNPVTYALVTDMMWEQGVPDLRNWEEQYLRSRYGRTDDTLSEAWMHIFSHYYTQSGQFETNPVIRRPFLATDDIRPSADAVAGAAGLAEASSRFGSNDAFRYDIVNLYRQVFGQYAGHLLHEITMAYQAKDKGKFEASVSRFLDLTSRMEKLLATREEFLFGKWVCDAKRHARNPEEEKLYEWNARAIVTTWGGRVLYGYAIKDWAGLYSTYYIPKWEKFFSLMRNEINGGDRLDIEKFTKDLLVWEDTWNSLSETPSNAIPEGDPTEIALGLWKDYGRELTDLMK
jgi:alpha-N-acetylglucosaminidase